ncbi:hypothetical protein [Desulfopila aestuarii]|uniref:Uncharacterized protein n=1 Tax=Desulfopila aestuarii DSM 18488 TaxID=1121416 RepID=A0A1M7YG78_9BACT|nr:hypothetical protein [Desulfopila aestuarii]SHO51579.1 hypothetical protein SAMN02745220_04075 [Desulfopila aestuarii DSM 18488]
MTTSIVSFNDYFPYCWDEEQLQEQWPVIHQPRQRLQLLADKSHPELYFSPIEDSMPVWLPSKRRATLDRFCQRLEASNYNGSDLAIAQSIQYQYIMLQVRLAIAIPMII